MARGHRYKNLAVTPKTDRPPDRREIVSRTEVQSSKGTSSIAEAWVWITLALLIAFSLLTFAYPMVRAFYRYEIMYNEGWNVYNTQTAMQHGDLYSAKHSWTGVNYPFLSFYLVGYASYFTGDYLLTGRLLSLLSLLVSCVLVGIIVRKLTGGWGPAVFAGALCLGLFCSEAPNYVGVDDPQMLAHPFFLFGLWLYLTAPPSTRRIAGITSIFVLGGNIKQNLLPAPISVLGDLFTTSSSKAVRFILFGILFTVLSIVVNILVGGPFFISNMLAPRAYHLAQFRTGLASIFDSLALPLPISIFWSVWQLKNPQARVISFYLFSSVLIGAVLVGGEGTNFNMFFDVFFAVSIILGACLDSLWKAPIPDLGKGGLWRFLVPILLYSTVIVAFVPRGPKLRAQFSALPLRKRAYDAEVAFLAGRPGPALCHDLMLCYDAGKPYIVHTFTYNELVKFGLLNTQELVEQIAEKKYGAIQSPAPMAEKPTGFFPQDVLDAIDRYYVEALKGPECYIYVPRVEPKGPSSSDE